MFSIRLQRECAANTPGSLLRRTRFGFGLICGILAPTQFASSDSLAFFINDPNQHDYAQQIAIPAGFGQGEFTLELWIKPDDSFPIGSTSGSGKLTNWSDADVAPLSAGDWWFEGNFLLDGFNNSAFENGTFALQFYGGGRVRWLFGDGVSPGLGGVRSIQAFPATNGPDLLDGQWHQITLVRRWSGSTDADLELWIDGTLIDSQTTPARTDMRVWWDAWSGFPAGQEGWFWGAEKQAAIGVLSQYEDYKGLFDELHFWSVARSSSEIMNDFALPLIGDEPGLLAVYRFEDAGTTSCDSLVPAFCMSIFNPQAGFRSPENSPINSIASNAARGDAWRDYE